MGTQKKDPLSMCGLGILYRHGFGVKQNYQKAKELYEESSKLGNTSASCGLGDLYRYGYGVEKNYEKAVEYYELSIKQNSNNTIAINRLGFLYYTGIGVKQDFQKAKELFEIGANVNDSESFNSLGLMYYLGQGVEKDYEKAKEYFELSAKQNYSCGLNNLGNLYLHGHGVEKNYEKAKEYYELAAKQNDSDAQINLGSIYKNGQGVARDYYKAKMYFELSAKQNNSIAFYKLGKLYYYGRGVDQEYKQSERYFLLAAKEQYHKAYYQLGIMYKNGQGVERNYQKAKSYFEISASLNNSDALYQIGTLYFYRYIDDDNNYIKAKDFFELSVQKNNLNSLFYLGTLYEKGSGVIRDISKAIEYYSDCSENRKKKYLSKTNNDMISFSEKNIFNDYYYRSNNDLGLIYMTEPEFQNFELAEKYLKEAGLNEYPFGQNNFGLFSKYYLNKKGNAEYMFQRASKHKFALSEFNLGRMSEEDGKIEESIDHYIKSSEFENEAIIFRNQIIDDERLEISKSFIICYANLKIANHYYSSEPSQTTKKYLLNAIFRPLFSLLFHSHNNSYSFNFIVKNIKGNFVITNLAELILNNPLFHQNDEVLKGWSIQESNSNNIKKAQLSLIVDICNQLNECKHFANEKVNISIKKENKMNDSDVNIDNVSEFEKSYNEDILKEFEEEILNIFNFINRQHNFKLANTKNDQCQHSQINNYCFIKFESIEGNRELCIKYPKFIFELLLYSIRIDENMMKLIIEYMEKILYSPPYSILFGRIKIYSTTKSMNQRNPAENINNQFYEGIGNLD